VLAEELGRVEARDVDVTGGRLAVEQVRRDSDVAGAGKAVDQARGRVLASSLSFAR
jgi:hypothetical protein